MRIGRTIRSTTCTSFGQLDAGSRPLSVDPSCHIITGRITFTPIRYFPITELEECTCVYRIEPGRAGHLQNPPPGARLTGVYSYVQTSAAEHGVPHEGSAVGAVCVDGWLDGLDLCQG